MSIASRIEQIEQHLKDDYDVLGLAGAKGTELPIGYTQVDYIESNGTQYIDTGYTPNINTEVIMEFKDTNKSSWENYFGSENFRFLRHASDSTAFRWVCVRNADMTNLSIDNKRKLKFNKNGIYDENETLIFSNPQTSLTSTKNMLLFLSWLGSSFDNFGIFIMYSFKIYDNGTLVRNFIPCYRNSDNEVGLYDLVNNVFYANKGTGAFTYGSVVLNRNIQNLKPQWLDRLVYFMNNGTDVVWNNWEKVTGSGETITLNNTIEAKMDFVYKGNTSQYSTTGKNLFDKDNVIKVDNKILNDSGVETSDNTGGYTKMYIPVNPNTTYTISGLQTNGTKRIYFFDNSKGFISRTSSQYNVSSFNFTTPNNCYYIDIQYYLMNNNFNTYQIEQGSTATNYEKYTGGNPAPNPDYPQDIQVVSGDNEINLVGKNLVNYDNNTNLENKYLNASGSFESAIYTYVNGTIKANSNKITISFNNSVGQGYVRIGEYKEDGTFIKRTLVSTTPTTLTLDSNTSYLIYSIDKNSDNYFEKLQLELGNQATTYEPYQSQSYPINIGNIELCKIGTYQDKIYKDNGKWYLNKQIGKIVYTGSESGSWTPSTFGGFTRFAGPIISDTLQTASRHEMKSNYFHYLSSGGEVGAGFIYAGQFFAYPNQTITTEQNFRYWLSTHNTTVYYVLSTPTYEEITDTTLISQLEAIKKSYNTQTNISQIPNDMPFELDVTALKDLDAEDTTPTLAINRGLSFTQPPVSENSINDENDNSMLEETINEEEPNIEDNNREEEEPVDFFEEEIINNNEDQEEIPTEPIEIDNGQR